MTTLEEYIWVVNALYRAGKHGLSLRQTMKCCISDICELYEND